jgi:hypothetical protein
MHKCTICNKHPVYMLAICEFCYRKQIRTRPEGELESAESSHFAGSSTNTTQPK